MDEENCHTHILPAVGVGEIETKLNKKARIMDFKKATDKNEKERRSTKAGAMTMTYVETNGLNQTNADKKNNNWMKQYNDLRVYREKHGHCNVTPYDPLNRRLGIWVCTQRTTYRKYKAGSKSPMTENWIQLLEELDFTWELGRGYHSKKGVKPPQFA